MTDEQTEAIVAALRGDTLPSAPQAGRCGACGGPLPPPAETGRPRRYCGPTCRARAHYRRKFNERNTP